MPRHTARLSLVILTLGLSPLSGCINHPMFCTPETCVAITDQDLPSEFRGEWAQSDDPSRLLFVDSFQTPDGDGFKIVEDAAGIRWKPLPAGTKESWSSRITSFDGVTGTAEQLVGEDKRSPRRIHRVWIEGDRLHVATLDLSTLLAAYEKRDASIVQLESGEALVYQDTRSMQYTVELMMDRPEAWGPAVVYDRVPEDPAQG